MKLEQVFLKSLIWRGLYFFSLLLVNVALSHILSAEGNGRIYYLSNIFSFIQLVSSFCLETGIGYYAANKKIARNKLFFIAVIASLSISFLLLIGIKIYQFAASANLIETPMLWYGFYYVTGISLVNNIVRLFYAEDDFASPNSWLSIINFAFALFAVIAFYWLHKSYSFIVDAYFISFFLGGIILIALYLLKNKNRSFSLPEFAEIKQVFKYAAMALAANVIFFLVYRIDYWFVHNSPVCTETDLGNYIQASKMGQLMLVVPQILSSVVFPRTAAGETNETMHNALFILSRLLLRIYIIGIAITVLFGEDIFIFIFGVTFNTMHIPFLLLLPGLFAVSVTTILASYFAGKGVVRINIFAAFIALVFVVIADYFFVPIYGIVAAAITSSIAYIINLLVPLIIFSKSNKVSLFEFIRLQRSDFIWLQSLITKKGASI
jgi:O-antigen/teichoic acid export membrane protein